jgi:tRNA A-37 threonylcarbamoyl transferase component Bud32
VATVDQFGPEGRWRPTGVIGSGGQATVHAAVDTRFELPVAVKVLAENHAGNPELRERFLREAAVQRRLPGPLVPVYDLGETSSGQPFIVMPLADGGDLQSRIESWRRLNRPTVDDIAALASVLAETTAPLHRLGIVHRDLKPSNLLIFGGDGSVEPGAPLIGPTETVLLADLGLAKDLEDGSGLTVGGGTVGFRPPEQHQPGQVTQRADVWAASAVVHWFITGRPVAGDPAIDRAALLAEVPSEELADAIGAGLHADATLRPESIVAWHNGLRAAMVLVGPGAVGIGGRVDRPSKDTTRWWRRHPLEVALIALVIGGLVGGLLGAWAADGQLGANGGSSGASDDVVVSTEAGIVTASVQRDGVAVSVSGPAAIVVGATGRFEATIDGPVADLAWIVPSGVVHAGNGPDSVDFAVVGTRAGAASLTLLVTSTTGSSVQVPVPVRVVE